MSKHVIRPQSPVYDRHHIPLMRTHYWGTPQQTMHVAPGVKWVSSAGHGGFALSNERQAEMPAHLRVDEAVYEEDCDWALVALGLPALMPEWLRQRQTTCTLEKLMDDAERTLKQWHPKRWEKHHGRELLPGESSMKDRETFKAANADKYMVVTAWGSWAEGVPDGMVGVFAQIGEDRSRKDGKYFLVSGVDYKAMPNGFVIDLAKHQECPPISGKSKERR